VPPTSPASQRPTIHKFGGAALADPASIRRAIALVRSVRGPKVIVVSALAGVTDTLLAIGDLSVTGDVAEARRLVDRLASRHRSVTQALLRSRPRTQMLAAIDAFATECRAVVDGLAAVRELPPRARDHLLAHGERLSARIVAGALGTKAQLVDATQVIITDGRHGDAFPDLPATDRAARRVLRPLLRRGAVPVVPGFLGAGADGATVTLGRGGTDLTAVTLGRSLVASGVNLWKDVPGMLSADPRVVPDARVVPSLHVREAAELAYYGAKVLHPRALIPLERRRIPLRIRPFADPTAPGTVIDWSRPAGQSPVRAIAAIASQAMVTVEGNGMLGVPGIAERTFAAMHAAGISVSLITQASSEHSICFTVPAAAGTAAVQHLRAAFREELQRHEIDDVRVEGALATIAIVGTGMAGTKGVAARVFASLRDAGINIRAIAQGSSELNISVVVDGARGADAQRAIHRSFQLDRIGGGAVGDAAQTDLFILGYGQIGRRVAALAEAVRQPGVRLRVVGIADRSGLTFNADGFSRTQLGAFAKAKERGTPVAKLRGGRASTTTAAVQWAASHALQRPIVVDLTADETTPALLSALRAGCDVVLANKRPMTGLSARAAELRATADAAGRHILAEATVGAGLPILDTFAKLTESGDRVRQMEGCLSGTLGFVFDELAKGRPFSAVVRDARARGFTEPDPRDDLSGLDVGRKALTLGRLMGFAGELSDLSIESLVPAVARGWPLDRFLARLEEFDAAWSGRVAAAKANGRVLRYVARATPRRVTVGLQAVDASSPFASLAGTDNQVVFTTDRYLVRPLVVTGPGAGPAVTAAGVMNDILALARRAR
jgi:aspartokinase/homoserine dehydrogenase 1